MGPFTAVPNSVNMNVEIYFDGNLYAYVQQHGHTFIDTIAFGEQIVRLLNEDWARAVEAQPQHHHHAHGHAEVSHV